MNRVIFLLFPLTLFAETTGNLLSQDFTNGWTGTNQSSRHGTSTIAGVDGGNVESTISLSDTLNTTQINGGWTSTLGVDIWHWNNLNSITTMKQTITNTEGTVTTQIRNVANSGCGYINCGSFTTYTDSYTQGINSQSDYDITVKFTFDESSNSSNHYATDLKNPILTIEYSLLDTAQVAQLKTISEAIYNVVEDIDFYEYVPEEFNFEMTEQPIIEMSIIEEFYFEPQAIEELNAGVVDVFQEITYDNQTTFEEIPTEIKVEEVYEERQTEFQTADNSRVFESEPIREEVSTRADGEISSEGNKSITTEEVSGTENGNPSRESEERIADEPGTTVSEGETTQDNVEESSVVSEKPTTEDTVVAEEVDEPNGEGEAGGSESGDERTEVADSGEETLESRDTSVEDSRTEGTVRVSNQTITVESIEKKVNETLTRIDQRLVATSLIVARAMESPLSMDNYGKTNNNIFINQLVIDGGNYYDARRYTDGRNIYAQNQVMYKDIISKYNQVVQESIDNTIRAEEHLRSSRGY